MQNPARAAHSSDFEKPGSQHKDLGIPGATEAQGGGQTSRRLGADLKLGLSFLSVVLFRNGLSSKARNFHQPRRRFRLSSFLCHCV